MKGLQVENFDSLVEAGSIGLIKQLVEQGCGISFLYITAVKKELAEADCVKYRWKIWTSSTILLSSGGKTAFLQKIIWKSTKS